MKEKKAEETTLTRGYTKIDAPQRDEFDRNRDRRNAQVSGYGYEETPLGEPMPERKLEGEGFIKRNDVRSRT